MFSGSYRGQCRRVFGGYQESDSLDLRGILPSMEASTRCRAEVVLERNESGSLVPERQADISTPCDFASSGWVDLWRRWENKQRLVLYLCERHARELGLKW